MSQQLTPGVYVLEDDPGPRPIQAVGTNIIAVMGEGPDPNENVMRVVPVTNWSEFQRRFMSAPATQSNVFARAVAGCFQNGGGLLLIVNLGANPGPAELEAGLRLLDARDEVAIVIAPGFSDASSYELLLGHCERLEDRIAILDPAGRVDDTEALTRVGLAEIPGGRATAADDADDDDDDEAASPPPAGGSTGGARPRNSTFGTFYYPPIYVNDPITGEVVEQPPSGHLAGVYSRVDQRRGVHKAPANETLVGAVNLAHLVSKEEQGELNRAGVNVIRNFPRQGIKIWGARTLEPDGPYRYLNVRRLVNMIKESIEEGTQHVVFEPNDYRLWAMITRDVSAFLTRIWRDGALLGRTPEEAFFVKCDRETNPDEEIDAGRVNALVGLVPSKPAEFVIFRISQVVNPGDDAGEE